MEKIIGTILARNEEDIIGDCIRHNLASGVTEIILTDNRSVDATREIASRFPEVTIIDEPSNEYRQGEWQNRMAEMALKRGADWVVPIDADELWDGIANLYNAAEYGVVVAECIYEHPPTDFIVEPFSVLQMPFFTSHVRFLEGWQCGRFAFRPYAGVKISLGQDRLLNYSGRIKSSHEMCLHHYPIRSYDRYVNKVLNGVQALDEGKHSKNVGFHWRDAYRELQDGTLREKYNNIKKNLI